MPRPVGPRNDAAAGRVIKDVQPGSIVLFHNAALHTPEALPGIIEQLLRDGYTFVPISQIILPQPYTIDHTGRQLPAAASLTPSVPPSSSTSPMTGPASALLPEAVKQAPLIPDAVA